MTGPCMLLTYLAQARVTDCLDNLPRSRSRPQLLLTQRPGVAVVMGAVRYGLSPDTLAARKLRFSYGVKARPAIYLRLNKTLGLPPHTLHVRCCSRTTRASRTTRTCSHTC